MYMQTHTHTHTHTRRVPELLDAVVRHTPETHEDYTNLHEGYTTCRTMVSTYVTGRSRGVEG